MFFEGKYSGLKLWQWLLFITSQVFIVFAIVRRLFEELYKYVSDNYILAVKISTYIIILILIYFIVGYVLYSTKRIYKFLYKIEDKNTKTDLLISYLLLYLHNPFATLYVWSYYYYYSTLFLILTKIDILEH